MNDSLKAGLQQIKDEAFVRGYKRALKDAGVEVTQVMNTHESASCALWAVRGGLSRLETSPPGDGERK